MRNPGEGEDMMFRRLRMTWALQEPNPCLRFEKAARAAFMQMLPESAALSSLRRCCWALDSGGEAAYLCKETFEKLIDLTPAPLGRWHGVDFDGTLSTYVHGSGWRTGEPIPITVAAVKALLAQGECVKLMTARVSPKSLDELGKTREEVVSELEAWCKKHIGQVLEITHEKDVGMVSLRDDLAIQVVPNLGLRVDGVKETDTLPGTLVIRDKDSDKVKVLTGRVIRFNAGIESTECDYDEGMLARVVSATPFDAYSFKLVTDFSEFEACNKAKMVPSYWENLGIGSSVSPAPSRACLKWCDTVLYPGDKRCEDYIGYGTMPFDVVTG